MKKRELLETGTAMLEWRSYRDQPARFMAECVWVPSPRSADGRVLFELYDYQEDTLETWLTNRFAIVLKARQLGLSTLAMAYALHHLLFVPGATVILVSKDQPTANKALSLMEFMWDFLPGRWKRLAPELTNDSATEKVWTFADGMKSRIVSRPATDSVGVSETATLVLWDEAALARDGDGTYRALDPTTDAGGQFIVFSTARGGHNRFAKLWRLARNPDSKWATVFHSWRVSRLIDEHDYEAKKADFKDKPWLFYAEYPESPEEAFRQSGRQRFDTLLEEGDDRLVDFPVRGRLAPAPTGGVQFVPDELGPLRLRDSDVLLGAPEGALPVVSVDPATGTGGDYTAMTGGWLEDGVPVRVAFWHANDIEPVDAAEQADLLGRLLGGTRPAKLVVEKAGGYGETFIHELRMSHGYPNLYVHRKTGHRKRKSETTFGFPMTYAKRPMVIDHLARFVIFDGVHTTIDGVDELLNTELGQFVVTENGKVQADTGCYDDLVMSTAIWLWVLTESVGEGDRGATQGPVDEDHAVTHSIAYVFEEAEKVRRAKAKRNRREMSRYRRSRSRR